MLHLSKRGHYFSVEFKVSIDAIFQTALTSHFKIRLHHFVFCVYSICTTHNLCMCVDYMLVPRLLKLVFVLTWP